MSLAAPLPDWEAFYRDYRKPGYVPGFEITTKLGGGTFGLVFRARRMSIGKDYAIKFLQVEDGEVRKAVLGELEQVQYFAQIDHPNLVSIEDRGEVDGIPYLVMAFAGTETLRDRMVAGQVPSGEAKDELLRLFLQSCRGLSALHERSLVHFDIKPANVFLKGSVARLGDYGLSKLVTHSRGSLSMGRGTPYYMAPELLQRRGDHRSDVYSLGVMLYELLCGALPFTGASEWEVLKKHETAAPALPAHLSPRERAILQRCLAKEPAARFQSVHDLIAAFGAPAGVGAAAIATRTIDVAAPGCVPPLVTRPTAVVEPPPLPGQGAPVPLPLRPTPRRRAVAAPPSRSRRALAFATLLVVGMVLFALRAEPSPWPAPRASRDAGSFPVAVDASSPSPASARGPRSGSGGGSRRRGTGTVTRDQTPFDQLLATAARTARTAAQHEQRVAQAPLELERLGVARDATACDPQVRQFARSPQFSTAMAERIEQLGRPAFCAAVAYLNELDFEDAADCRTATQVLKLLGQFVGTDVLEVEMVGPAPCVGDTCRFLAVADAWRRVAEQFGKDDATFRALLVERGKQKGADR